MMDKIIAELMSSIVNDLKKDKGFKEFHEKMMKGENFFESLKEKMKVKECNCIKCRLKREIIDLINNDVQKEVDSLDEIKQKAIINFFAEEIENGTLEDFEEARLEFEKNLKKVIEKYTDATLVFLSVKKVKEKSND